MNRRIAWLSGKQSEGIAGHWEIQAEKFVIGRREPANLVLPVPRISRRHAVIEYRDLGYWLEDLGSRNGTFVNGTQLRDQAVKLVGGDEIVLGGSVTLRFNDPDETMSGPMLGRLHGIWIDDERGSVWIDAIEMVPALSPAQLTLLRLLYENAGKVVSRADIVATVWPDVDASGVSGEAVDGLIKRLRKRLRSAQPKHEYVQVVRGHGLRLVHPDE